MKISSVFAMGGDCDYGHRYHKSHYGRHKGYYGGHGYYGYHGHYKGYYRNYYHHRGLLSGLLG